MIKCTVCSFVIIYPSRKQKTRAKKNLNVVCSTACQNILKSKVIRKDLSDRNRMNRYKGNTRHGKRHTVEYRLYHAAKGRAKKKHIDFSIKLEDVIIPVFCPLLGIEIIIGVGKLHDNSATIDRKDSSKGYTKDNTWIISYKANRAKNNLSLEEASLLVKNWKESCLGL